METASTDSEVRCNICHSKFKIASGGKSDIEKHLKTFKHIKAAQILAKFEPNSKWAASIDTSIVIKEGINRGFRDTNFKNLTFFPNSILVDKKPIVFDPSTPGIFPYECYKCKVVTDNVAHMKKHMKEHVTSTPHECKICGMFFSTHQFNQHLCKGSSIQCEYCSTPFDSIVKILDHLNTQEHEKRYHKCDYCPKTYSMRYLLECHNERVHGNQSHICTECNRKFSDARLLWKHQKTHSTARRNTLLHVFSTE